tara:strand:- start:338 stop:622 length:285 start_codon:yes stop_codon:yes gene_type:complete
MMDVSSETYIRLTEVDLGKLDVIQSSIEEATTHRQLVRGGIDNLYINSLRYLYRDGEITDEGLENGLSHVEDYMAEKIKKVIEKDMAEINNSSG